MELPFSCTVEYILAVFGICFTAIIGILVIVRVVESVNIFVYARLRPPDLKKYGPWAVITGATDGIGKSYACQLAERGINIILISRNPAKLTATSEELQERYGIEVEIIQADFTEGWNIYGTIKECLKDKKIGILVNNVGTSEEGPCRFLNRKESSLVNFVNVNINSVLIMTHIVLPQMIGKKKGAIVTVSSFGSMYRVPRSICYGATKAATNTVSRSLHYEYKTSGVVFQTLIPAFVKTKLIPFSNAWKWFGPLVPDPNTYCRSAVVTLNVSNLTTGYWFHELYYAVNFIPRSLLRLLKSFILR